ncbi:hypothetical protein LEL_08292 [Akanthomyces lecanii RCEF 1005]|uniref:Uncharacterized protein n=1 Tax=Akanthomyces lecanii RCEF 1005 TaxID=1081108 RepID=A0A168F5Z5_CORDF|nr:hypothetical protein LEL_08292 [Akanthomyces lecanii RCEF 1005]
MRSSSRSPFVTSARWKSDRPEDDKLQQQQLIYPAPKTTQHSDLASFQSYAKRTGLDEKSTVYVGTHYEYAVVAHLARYGFDLRRIGGARDRGTDLVGTWTIPTSGAAESSSSSSQPLKVLVQCKAGSGQRVGPQHMRELEGAFAGAPPGWRGSDSGVLAVMVCERQATKGVREALGHSRWPMAFVYCEGGGGAVRQMLWNKRAEEHGLQGVGVGTRHVGEETELVLLRKGKMLPFVSGGKMQDAGDQ